ncbi:NAD(P)-dependent oxidoreductase [Kyrpidia sp.]|uniref:NAD(P)-dependent oxidoreductase n=1 Tax=Kyrpidia sp. TaxID=2073077 RepID=UPI002584C327|nr:NAD(P)-dependent oxidoreductase [Kyrpidia sp.]MCL6575024.1 NAD(P)-dependent oxidoreductase [Kyrpidia sp.]
MIDSTAVRAGDRLQESIHPPLSEWEVVQEAHRCLYCYDAPCTKACPTRIDVPSFIQKITTGNFIGSAKVILEANPVGASCARVCPTEELCEGACVLSEERAPIRIGDLQRYVTDWIREQGVDLFTSGMPTGKRVAVIGAGPAGLSAARELALFGHEVAVYEAKSRAGGLNTYGIVPFRLPAEVALWEVEQVKRLGVVIRTGVRVGEDFPVEKIVNEYDAVVLAFGMGGVPLLGIPGEESDGVWDALEFIERVKDGRLPEVGKRVAVIGAGNTAVDAATCALRIGAESVTMYYRRTEREMTAYPSEYDFAKSEGVEFRWLCAPVRILADGRRVRGVEFVRMRLDAADDSGRPRPVPIPGSEFTVEADAVIRAIGQSRRTELVDRLGLTHDDGVIRVDEQMRTSHPKIFAVGDCVFQKGRGEAMVVEAAEQGKRAAAAVHHLLVGGSERSGGEQDG